jgi:hypothetical protein
MNVLDVELVVDGDPSGDELRSLRRWLLDVPEFRGRVSMRESVPGPGELGSRLDVVVLALSGAVERSAEALEHTLAAWLSSRCRPGLGARRTLTVQITPGEVVASVSIAPAGGQLDPSVRAFIDGLTERMRRERAADRAAGNVGSAPIRPSEDGVEGWAGLADDEVIALAEAFGSRAKAVTLLRKAGLRPELFAAFDVATDPQAYWVEVGHELALGRALDGRRRLLAAAAAEYPGNLAFRGYWDGARPAD